MAFKNRTDTIQHPLSEDDVAAGQKKAELSVLDKQIANRKREKEEQVETTKLTLGATDTLETLNTLIAEKKEVLKELEVSCADANTKKLERNKLSLRVDELRSDIAELEEIKVSLESGNKQLREDNTRSSAVNVKLDEQRDELKADVAKLELDKKNLENEIFDTDLKAKQKLQGIINDTKVAEAKLVAAEKAVASAESKKADVIAESEGIKKENSKALSDLNEKYLAKEAELDKKLTDREVAHTAKLAKDQEKLGQEQGVNSKWAERLKAKEDHLREIKQQIEININREIPIKF